MEEVFLQLGFSRNAFAMKSFAQPLEDLCFSHHCFQTIIYRLGSSCECFRNLQRILLFEKKIPPSTSLKKSDRPETWLFERQIKFEWRQILKTLYEAFKPSDFEYITNKMISYLKKK